MRIAIIGPPSDVHLKRWGLALREAGAEILFVGIGTAEPELEPYYSIGPPLSRPRWIDFVRRRRALFEFLTSRKVDVAHPIHLTPSAVWVWLSGFRPYVPFAMGADVLEYVPNTSPIVRSWTLQSRSPTLLATLTARMRRALLPSLLRKVLQHSLLACADNYELCFSEKFFIKNKCILEVPAGISSKRWSGKGKFFLAPRGATLLYQADIILDGYRLYLTQGGTRPLILLAGGYPIHPEMEAKAAELEINYPEKFFFFRKKIPEHEMEILWEQTAAFISAPVYDGYSYAVAEGRQRGALPIVNAIPAHLEILTHGYNAWFVEPFTAENLAQGLFEVDKLLQGEHFWQERNQKWISFFSDIKRNAQLFLSFVEERLRQR
ncbi:MAG: hypothetical protein N2253_07615 [Bacteroidia bacterium]|nr:hypothetical protein [Bacteroidia bacterium]MCX7764740.1 hypothetical protein [Bacteroidia bacterium]MDW8057327.1 hypothetical protein [Bacteroidia bacterium]